MTYGVDDPYTPLGYQLFGDSKNPYTNPALRQRIVMAMMGRRERPFPKTFGEGLAAIGQALGDRGNIQSLLADDQAAQQYASTVKPPDVAAPYAAPSAAATSSLPPAAAAQKVQADEGVSDGGYNFMDAAATQPQPGAAGTTPASYANVRYNNPGAAWPSQDAATYGSTNAGVIGGGNKIAQFESPVHGAAANLALLDRGYTGMPVSAAISKWSGGGRSALPGFDPSTVITKEMLRDPKIGIPLMKAIASGEAPGQYPMSDEQWNMAHQWFTQGGPPPGQGGARDKVASTMLARAEMQPPDVPPQPSPIAPGTQFAALTPRDTASDIQTAPPLSPEIRTLPQQQPPPQTAPQQVAQLTPPPAAPYEMERPTPPTPVGVLPPHAYETWAQQERAKPGYNEYVERRIAPYEAQGKQARELQQKLLDAKFNMDYQHYLAKDTAYQAWQASREEREQKRAKAPYELNKLAAETSKTQTEAEAGKVPTTREIGGATQQYDPVSKTWITPPTAGPQPEGPPNVKMNEDQGNAVRYARRMVDANNQLGDAKALMDAWSSTGASLPVFGNYLQSTAYQRANTAASAFITAKLRKESGAAISQAEYAREYRDYFPIPGDSKETIADKARRRQLEIDSMKAEAGPGRAIIDYYSKHGAETQSPAAKESAAPAAPPVQVQSLEEAMKLPKGTKFITPDGRIKER